VEISGAFPIKYTSAKIYSQLGTRTSIEVHMDFQLSTHGLKSIPN